MRHLRPVLPFLLALAAPALGADWPRPDRPSFTAELRTAYRGTSGVEAGASTVAYAGASFADQSLAFTAFPHEALGLEVDVGRHVALLSVGDAAAPPVELWDAAAGLVARADLDVLLADAHVGYALAQLPSLVRGPGAPSSLHGPRLGLGLVAPLPAGFFLSARGALLLPFLSRDGRGERGDASASEVQFGVGKRIGSVGGKSVGVRLDFRQRHEVLRGGDGALLSQVAAQSVGLSLTLAGAGKEAP